MRMQMATNEALPEKAGTEGADRASWEPRSMSTEEADGQESTECPTCGRDDFATRQGMKTHHKRIHGESIAGEPVECEQCGVEFRRPPSRDDGRRHFCDDDCRAEYWSENFSGASSWHWEAGIERSCVYCGATYRPTPSRTDESRFCSMACFGKWRSENIAGEDHPNWDGGKIETACTHCGDTVQIFSYEADRYRQHFCDDGCRGEWLSENVVGTDHPLFEGGEAPYGEGWNKSKKEAVRERDNRTCQHCGRTEAKHVEKFGAKHTVHHIVPARQFDDPEPRNAKGNLITLCRGECHRKWEQMAPLRPST